MAEEATTSLQEAFDAWESKVDELEAFVATQAFAASHQNAGEYVEWAVDECREAFDGQLDALRQLGDVLEGQLQEMAVEVKRSADTLVEQSGAALTKDLDETNQVLAEALQALAGVKALLASYSFVQV